MLKNDYLAAKIGVDTAENEPRKEELVCGDPVPARREEADHQASPGRQDGSWATDEGRRCRLAPALPLEPCKAFTLSE